MNQQYFSELIPALAERARLSAISRLGFANVPLRRHLSELFSRPFAAPGAFLADPTFEAVFGWKKGDQCMNDLADSLLTPELVAAMDAPPAELKKDYRFAKNQFPYAHQIEAWKILSDPQPKSLIVASGTGSGKTECFMVPILDSLVRERQRQQGKLIGVRALFLYPLNALINSQRDRFRAWTKAFGGDIRFCLYNGNTPERPDPARIQNQYPNEVLDRTSLRRTPPSLLVTNATMLEYMLVRTADAPILDGSQGKLQWVVLDEAHTYVGSQAAEAALLIRRVLLAFGVKPEQVRFVATSATIGDPEGEAGKKLKRFLADVAGTRQENVFLVAGQREIPGLPEGNERLETTLSELAGDGGSAVGSPENTYTKLLKNSTARRIRHIFVGDASRPPVATLKEVCGAVFGQKEHFSVGEQEDALRWLDILSQAKTEEAKSEAQTFLPLRAHIFHQTLSGIWACADPDCRSKKESLLDDPSWPFGKIYFEPRKFCDCLSPVYEVVKCGGCGSVHLKAGIDARGVVAHLQPLNALDEFELETEDYEGREDAGDEETKKTAGGRQTQMLIVNQNLKRVGSVNIERASRRIVESSDSSLRVQAYEDDGGGLICPVCEEKDELRNPLFYSSRLGAPFLIGGILPTMLEYAPDGEKPADFPCRGRRLLSFNDSRQGTARMAIKLQQEAERNRIRGLIYHLVLAEGHKRKGDKSASLANRIEQFETLLQGDFPASARSAIESQLNDLRAELEAVSHPSSMPFNELAQKLTLQGKDFDRMLAQYRRYAPGTFSDASGPMELAKIFLVREFGRRPKRLNNLETMGLVGAHYPALDKIQLVPARVAQEANFDLKEWRDFLKITLDFFVRGGGSLEIMPTWRNWLGMKYPQKFIVSRDEEDAGRAQRRWHRAKRSGMRSSLVRLLAYIMKADITTPEGEDRIDAVLEAAWHDLNGAGLLTLISSDGRLMTLDKLSFKPIEGAWICPITRRFLDTTIRGVTPYLPEKATEATAQCQFVTIPLYDEPFGGVTDDLERIRRGREWLKNQKDINELRDQGLWEALNDRVIELAPYFTAAEHSAQQDSKTLQRYEKDFKDGALNLLSCSTTMEMGIDIGGISMVAMNNVPPHPANYLQRAGRAGRRRESRSLAVTLCKSNPHDQNVFSNTRWAFDSQLPAPRVSLDSPVIVQRHVHSFLLSKFLGELLPAGGVESTKLTCGLFFIGEPSMTDKFAAWCLALDSSETGRNLLMSMDHIVRHSILESQNHGQILDCASSMIKEIADAWLEEWKQLEEEELEFQNSAGENNPALRAVRIHKTRLSEEYLLRELATRGFLPAYGFPTNIAPFDNMTLGRLRIEQRQSREDNRYQRRELASRDLTTALREYAPGSKVVMDGLVYTSAGVTLNWHIPADQHESKEIQNIRFAWRCRKCGSSRSTHSLTTAQHCQICGASIGAGDIREFLEPAGFAVDFYSEPGNDVSTQDFVPVEVPWIDAEGDWFPLTNPDLGRFRTTTRGHVFHQSRGIYGSGYALCLECGRAEPMQPDGGLPAMFENPHRKLRRTREDAAFCPGSYDNWKIKRGITLGHESWTDVFELQLKDAAGIWLGDETAALTLAVALRDALAELLGVQAAELGCDIKPARTETGGVCQSILIFDRFAAGYASGAERFIPEIFRYARNRLICQANCDSVCPHCVLDFDQRFAADRLDRHAAASFLTDEWLDSLRLPENLAFFGKDSFLEHNRLFEALLIAVSKRSIGKIRLYTLGETGEWDIAPSPLREFAYKLAGRGINVEIMLPEKTVNSLETTERLLLSSLGDYPGITFRTFDFTPRAGEGWVIAEAFGGASIRWAVPEKNTLICDGGWGENSDILVRAENSQPFADPGKILTSGELRPNLNDLGDKELEIQHELNGNLQGFGKRFWDYVCTEHFAARGLFLDENERLVSVSYNDRYLFSPLALALLLELIKGLKINLGGERTAGFTLNAVTTEKYVSYNNPTTLWSDWNDSQVRDRVAKMMFDETGIDFSIATEDKSVVGHGRILELTFSSGKKLTVRLDQGVSYWQAARMPRWEMIAFNFNADDSTQRDRILNLNIGIEGAALPTQIFLKVRQY